MSKSSKLFIAIFLFVSLPVVADSIVLEEVIVTAQKREENIQDVGISISALSGELMRKLGYTNSTEIVAHVPGVQNFSTMGRGASSSMYIRGVGLNDFGDAHESPVVAYADEFYLLPQTALDFSLYDLARVEIVRGPQGTLFGRNSTGGLIHFVTNKPSQEFDAYVDGTFASFNEVRFEGAIGGGLSENVSGRLSWLVHEADGYIKNRGPFPDGADAGAVDIRGQISWQPTEKFRIFAKVQYGERDLIPLYTDHDPVAFDPETGLAFLNPDGVDAVGFNEKQIGVEAPREVWTDNPQKLDSESTLMLLRAEWDLEGFTLTSITGYLDLRRRNIEDCDGTINNVCTAAFPFDNEHWTQEIRAEGSSDRVRWTAGFFYLHQDAEAHPEAAFFGGAVTLDGPWQLETDSWSLFGQVEYEFTDSLALTTGIRFTQDKKKFEEEFRVNGEFPTPASNFTKEALGDLTERTDDLISAKVALNWSPSDDVLVYGSISRGTKAGGFNNGFFSIVEPEDVPYGDETLYAYEVGFKTTWWGGRARFNAAVFYYDYSDFQTFNWLGIGGAISNADAQSYGGEAEISIAPTGRLDLTFGIALLDSEIKDVDNGVITRDVKMAFAPSLDMNGLARYHWPFMNGELAAQVDFTYAGERFNNNFNDPASELDDYFVTNARLSYLSSSEQWELSAFVQNLTDETNLVKTFVFPFLYRQAVYDPPRIYGVSLRIIWN